MQMYSADKMNVLHFQHKIYDLELGYFEVLETRDFCEELQHYLKRLFVLGHNDIIINVLEKVGSCVTEHKEKKLRAKALQVITEFTGLLNGQKDRDLFNIVAKIYLEWLRMERNNHSTQENLLLQIGKIINKMLSLQLWHQVEPLVTVLRGIMSGTLPVDSLLKKEVSKLHSKIADKQVIQTIIQGFLETKEPSNTVTGNLLLALTPHSSEAMIHSLFKCSKKDTRLAFLKMIPQDSEGVLPILIEKLKDKQPWYVIRNSMILLGAIEDADLYPFARPFLNHPDSRVQREVVLCIVSLGGEEVVSRLIGSFHHLNDDVKAMVIEQLQPFTDPNIDTLFVDVLEQRVCFEPSAREDLICEICASGKLIHSERVITILEKIVEEREALFLECGSSLDIAKTSLENLQS